MEKRHEKNARRVTYRALASDILKKSGTRDASMWIGERKISCHAKNEKRVSPFRWTQAGMQNLAKFVRKTFPSSHRPRALRNELAGQKPKTVALEEEWFLPKLVQGATFLPPELQTFSTSPVRKPFHPPLPKDKPPALPPMPKSPIPPLPRPPPPPLMPSLPPVPLMSCLLKPQQQQLQQSWPTWTLIPNNALSNLPSYMANQSNIPLMPQSHFLQSFSYMTMQYQCQYPYPYPYQQYMYQQQFPIMQPGHRRNDHQISNPKPETVAPAPLLDQVPCSTSNSSAAHSTSIPPLLPPPLMPRPLFSSPSPSTLPPLPSAENIINELCPQIGRPPQERDRSTTSNKPGSLDIKLLLKKTGPKAKEQFCNAGSATPVVDEKPRQHFQDLFDDAKLYINFDNGQPHPANKIEDYANHGFEQIGNEDENNDDDNGDTFVDFDQIGKVDEMDDEDDDNMEGVKESAMGNVTPVKNETTKNEQTTPFGRPLRREFGNIFDAFAKPNVKNEIVDDENFTFADDEWLHNVEGDGRSTSKMPDTTAGPSSRTDTKTDTNTEIAFKLPFISHDENENRDNSAKEWDVMKMMATDDDRYRMVRMKWKNKKIPDPDVNLTTHNFRIKRTGDVKVGKRKRSIDDNGRPAKRFRPCTEHFERGMDGLRNNMQGEKIKLQNDFYIKLNQLNNERIRQTKRIEFEYARNKRMGGDLNSHAEKFRLQKLELTEEFSYTKELLERIFNENRIKLERPFYIELDKMKKAREEVSTFFKFYSKLKNSSHAQDDITRLDADRCEEISDIERFYSEYHKHYRRED